VAFFGINLIAPPAHVKLGGVVRIYSITTVNAGVKPLRHHHSVFAPFQIAPRLLTDLIAEDRPDNPCRIPLTQQMIVQEGRH
jgi:hypothetical protein